MNNQKQLNKNLQALTLLETDFKDTYDDKELLKEINLYKESLGFFLQIKDFDRAFYETESLIKRLVYYLVD